MEVVSRVVCFSLLLTNSLPEESHFEPSSAVMSQVVSLGISLLSLLVLAARKDALRSCSQLLAGVPGFEYPF